MGGSRNMARTTLDIGAFHAALDAKRQSIGWSWRNLAFALALSPSTFTRIASGRRPDVDTFVALLRWLDAPAERFMLPSAAIAAMPEPVPAPAYTSEAPGGDSSKGGLTSPLRLTIVGSGGGIRLAEEACPSYLVSEGDQALLVECGPGVATRLRRYVLPDNLVGVVLSHMHLNNFYDLVPLAVMRHGDAYDPFTWEDVQALPTPPARLPVYLPPGGANYLRRIIDAVGDLTIPAERNLVVALASSLALYEYQPDTPFRAGAFSVCPIGPVAHGPGTCFALRISGGAMTIGYSGESALCDALYDVARDANLFLCEAMGITRRVRRSRHLSADEAGHVAARGGARRLVLTHLASASPSWGAALVDAASAYYDGPVDAAREGDVFALSDAHDFPVPP